MVSVILTAPIRPDYLPARIPSVFIVSMWSFILNRYGVVSSFRPNSSSRSLNVVRGTAHGNFVIDDVMSLSAEFREAYYRRGHTDGIRFLCKGNDYLSKPIADTNPAAVVEACRRAADTVGHAASMINAVLASFDNGNYDGNKNLIGKNQNDTPTLIVEAMENAGITPDLVTLSCAYAATRKDAFLHRAARLAKRNTDSKRRKAMNRSSASQSSTTSTSVKDFLDELASRSSTSDGGLSCLYEDEDVVGLYKPSDMVCCHVRRNSSSKKSKTKKNDASVEDLLSDLPTLSNLNPQGRGIVHRLDRGTSGCLLLAKNDAAHALLTAAFFRREVRKNYLCALNPDCDSSLPSLETSGTIELDVNGKPARSTYEVVGNPLGSSSSVMESGTTKPLIWLRVTTQTGRRHQVRQHCAHGLGRPILGDRLYGNDDAPSLVKHRRSSEEQGELFLHAESLTIPSMGIDLRAPPPGWWSEVLQDQ